MSRDHCLDVLKFWRAIETFYLPEIPTKSRNDNKVYRFLEPGGTATLGAG